MPAGWQPLARWHAAARIASGFDDFPPVLSIAFGTVPALVTSNMETMLVAVFESEAKARDASRALEALAEADTIRLNAGAIVTKGAGGAITVSGAHRPAPEGTLGGTAVGTLIGMLGGVVGLAIGAATGLALGAATDVFDMKVARDFLAGVERSLEPGKSAVVAQIYEEDTGPVNERMAALEGIVFRRALGDVADEEHEKNAAAIRRRFTRA